MTACDEGAVWPASHAPLTHDEVIEKRESRHVRVVSAVKSGKPWRNTMGYWFVIMDITLLTGDDLFMKLVAAVVELVSLPVSQKNFTAAHLHTYK